MFPTSMSSQVSIQHRYLMTRLSLQVL
jgi:hypothetical protein